MIKNKDIAKLLKISTATVSLARNNKPGVSEETKKNVQEIILDMAEKEAQKQGALKGAQGTIAFVIHKKHGKVISDTPFFLTLTESIQNVAAAKNFNVNILHYNEDDDISNHLLRCCDESINGILLLASEMEASDLAPYFDCGKPAVILDSHYPDENLNTVIINNKDAVRKCVKYAYQMGHRKIGCLKSSVYTTNFVERYQGYLSTMRELGLEVEEEYIYHLRCTSDDAYDDMKQLLERGCKLPTLLIAGNDLLAIGALKALKEKGFSVPGDVSIIGFDDMPISRMMDPPLTSVRIFINEIAREAIKRLIERIQEEDSCTIKIEVAGALMIRDSVKQLN